MASTKKPTKTHHKAKKSLMMTNGLHVYTVFLP